MLQTLWPMNLCCLCLPSPHLNLIQLTRPLKNLLTHGPTHLGNIIPSPTLTFHSHALRAPTATIPSSNVTIQWREHTAINSSNPMLKKKRRKGLLASVNVEGNLLKLITLCKTSWIYLPRTLKVQGLIVSLLPVSSKAASCRLKILALTSIGGTLVNKEYQYTYNQW